MKKQFDPSKTIFVIDGSSFLYRAYYALKPLHTLQGEPVQAVYSFCRMIKKIIKKFDPQYLCLVWDSKGKTTRHEIFPAYKATRQEPPSDLFQQKEHILKFADLISIAQVAQPGIEADDLMYSIAKDRSQAGDTVVLITADKDMGQMLSDNVVIFDPFKDIIIDEQSFQEKMGFPVDKLPFYFALLGDSSDNIPGVKGIGAKGAQELVNQFESLNNLYKHIDQVPKERTRKLLLDSRDNAFLSEKLFLLRYYKANSDKQFLSFDKSLWKNAYPLFKELNFKSLLKELESEIAPEAKLKLSEFKNYNFITVSTEEQLKNLCAQIESKKLCAIDTELTGLNPLHNHVVGISICVQEGTAYYIPYGHQVMELQLDQQTVFSYMRPILENPDIKKIMHHAKFDMLAFKHYGINVQGLIFDTLIAAHLTTKDWQRVNLKYLSEYYLQEPMLTYADAVTNNGYKNFSDLPLDLATEYAASDAHQTLKLYPVMMEQLKEHAMLELFETIEFPLLFVLYSMEAEGIYVDKEILNKLDKQVTSELKTIVEKINVIVGPEFKELNLNSPKQLKELLFDHLQLPPQKKTAGKTTYSTDQEVLEALAHLHPVPRLIVQYRTLFKLKSTYIDALPHYINPETGKVHTTFSQTIVATGRLASSEPNLQNIPTSAIHEGMISLRSAFKPEPGNLFIAADYSQIELRVLAYLSQDEALLSAFKRGADIHTETASRLFDVPANEITHEQRQLGKRINFSILYGLTPYGLSKDLNIPFGQAKTYIEKYFAQYPQVSEWMEEVIKETKKNGYVTTHWGRRRYIPAIYEQNKNLYENARRIAINTKAQGTAAELMKQGMIALAHKLAIKIPQAKLLLQIHDELLISVPADQCAHAESITKNVLEHVVDWNVPLEVTIRNGASWDEVTK